MSEAFPKHPIDLTNEVQRMTYVQGCVAAVPNSKREVYRQNAEKIDAIIRRCGAIKVVECWGDDVPDGEITSFPKAVKCKDDETVVFSWIVWESKEACQSGMQKMREEAETHFKEMGQVFDTKRMFFGGFEVLLEV